MEHSTAGKVGLQALATAAYTAKQAKTRKIDLSKQLSMNRSQGLCHCLQWRGGVKEQKQDKRSRVASTDSISCFLKVQTPASADQKKLLKLRISFHKKE